MRRVHVVIALVIALATIPAVALAASPKKGGTYKGQDPSEVRLVLKVSSSGKTARADLFCFKSHVSAIHKVPIKRGRFYGIRKTGSVKVFSIKGRFRSKSAATVTVSLKAACAGGDHHLKLALAP